jgi:hypothetical protein
MYIRKAPKCFQTNTNRCASWSLVLTLRLQWICGVRFHQHLALEHNSLKTKRQLGITQHAARN